MRVTPQPICERRAFPSNSPPSRTVVKPRSENRTPHSKELLMKGCKHTPAQDRRINLTTIGGSDGLCDARSLVVPKFQTSRKLQGSVCGLLFPFRSKRFCAARHPNSPKYRHIFRVTHRMSDRCCQLDCRCNNNESVDPLMGVASNY
jgi:hypothetical protein